MKTVHTVAELRESLATEHALGARIGFVPTMGALHDGHRSLLERARGESAVTVCSVFVNPTQFDDPADFEKYPQTLAADAEICRASGVTILFAPSAAEIYPHGYRFRVQESELSGMLEGAHRPGHFEGMLTVVLKLLQIVRPTRAYFGQKDFQQLTLVQDMVRDFFLPVEIVACATLRELSGLALSSRNARLTGDERARAAEIATALRASVAAADVRVALESRGFAVDYAEDFRGRRCVAARLGGVRLIDNVALEETRFAHTGLPAALDEGVNV